MQKLATVSGFISLMRLVQMTQGHVPVSVKRFGSRILRNNVRLPGWFSQAPSLGGPLYARFAVCCLFHCREYENRHAPLLSIW